jgi:outer membrane murein-binding lipoprotein Lpp
MVSKKLSIAIIVCLTLLLGAVGAYSYVEIVGLRGQVDSLHETVSSLETYVSSLENETNQLQSEVSTLESQIDALENELAHKNSTKTFNFYWEGSIAEYFNTTRFWMNATFERVNETQLLITVEVNDLREEWYADSYLGVVSKLTGSWRYLCHPITLGNDTFMAKQKGALGNYSGGQRFIDSIVMGYYTSNHECIDDLCVTYIIPVILAEDFLELWNLELDDSIHIEYARKVAVEFCFGMELIA